MSTILWLEMVSAMKKQTLPFAILMVEIAVEIVSTKFAALILQGRLKFKETDKSKGGRYIYTVL